MHCLDTWLIVENSGEIKGSRETIISDVEKMESKEGCRGGVCAVTAVNSRDDTESSTFPGSTWCFPVVC